MYLILLYREFTENLNSYGVLPPVGTAGPVGPGGSVGPVGSAGPAGSAGTVGFVGPSSSDSPMIVQEKP